MLWRPEGILRSVVIAAAEHVMGIDVTGPAEVFDMANRLDSKPQYHLELVAIPGGPVTTSTGFEVNAKDARRFMGPIDTLIATGGYGVEERGPADDLVQWVKRAAERSRRVCSVCTGSFILAAAGLLHGRRAATHWDTGRVFETMYPQVQLDLRSIYVRDGHIWTSAGSTAGIDLALALVEHDLGRSRALEIAKYLVVFLHRPGGQAQFSTALTAQARTAGQEAGGRFHELHAWIADNLATDLSVQALADHAKMSRRSFDRNYLDVMGQTPAKAVERIRVEAAARSLERGDVSIKRIAAICGFGSDEHLRRAFVRQLDVTPDQYRAAFGAPAGNDQAAA
jgi:transcriptional regulator GlxA family with amidase domain